MKKLNKKLTPVSLALLGGLYTLPSSEAVKASVCDQEVSNDTVTYTCHSGAETSNLEENLIFLSNELTESVYTYNFDDATLAVDDSNSANRGNPSVYIGAELSNGVAGAGPKVVNFNFKNFKSITGTGKRKKALVLSTYSLEQPINTNITFSGDDKRLIQVTDTGSNLASALLIQQKATGIHNLDFNAPNTLIEVKAGREPDNLYAFAKGLDYISKAAGNKVNINFNGKINVEATNAWYSSGLYFSFMSNETSATKEKLKEVNVANININGGEIIAKNAQLNHAVRAWATDSTTDTNFESNITVNAGTIKASGGNRDNYGVITYASNDTADREIQAVLTQNGGEVYADGLLPNGQLSNNSSSTYGLFAHTSGEKTISIITQNGGKVFVSNASYKEELVNAGIATLGYKARVTQNEGGYVKAEGISVSAIGTDSLAESDITVSGHLESSLYGINTVTRGQGTNHTRINITDTAKVLADFAIYNNEGHSTTVVAQGATIGREGIASRIELNEGNDHLTFNGTSLKNIGTIDGGLDANVETDFDTVVFNNYSKLDLADHLRNWERVELRNGSYQLSSSLATGKGTSTTHPSLVGGLVIEDAQLGFVANKEITIDGDILNNNRGLINLRLNGDGEFAKVVVNGDYHGNGGKLAFNTALNGDDSLTDRITFNGQVSGTTVIEVANKGGQGAETVKGIQLIKLGDSGNANADAFVLDSSTVAKVGDYEYKTLSFSDTDNKGFFLKSTKVEPVVVPDPAPKDPTPKDPDPKNPSPKNPDPVTPAPIDPSPADPITPAPVDPVPVAPTPVAPTPSIPDVVDPTVIPGSSENSNVTDVINSKDSTNLDVEDYAVAYRSGQALTAFNSSDLFYDHKNDQGFNVGFFSRASTAKGYYNRLVLSYGESQYRTSISINYGKGGWKNPNSTGTSSSKILGFTGEIAYRHADNFNYALYLDYSNSDSKVHRDYAIAGKAHQSIQNLKSNNLELSLRLSKDFDYANSILTPYFLMAYQHNAIKGFNEQFNLSAPVKSYHGLELAVPKQSFDLIRPEVGIIATHKLGSGLEFKGALYYSFLPETDFKASILGRKDTGETEVLNNDYSYKADHLFATRLALVKYFSNKLSIKAEGQLNKVTSLKGLTGSLELSLRYDF